MARWAIGDLQGCDDEFSQLLDAIRFRSDSDQLWLTGDLVNRGPLSLQHVHALRANVSTVLGNHDLHLLALAWVPGTRQRKSDTLQEILSAADRDTLLEWLLQQPLAQHDAGSNDLMVHAGIVPQWTVTLTASLATEVADALRRDPVDLLTHMYGNEPRRWDDSLQGLDRLRFIINALTRIRACTAAGEVDLKLKGPPTDLELPWMPWFEVPDRNSKRTRLIFGHWSALGLVQRSNLLALDTGCVWGGALTAVNLDDPGRPAVTVPSRQPRSV
jgi:bis(5'-nucleosyl)-tetraphosphatase (symmetrical)